MCIFYTHPPPYTRMLHNVEYVCVCRRHFSSTHTVGLSLSHDPIETSHLLRSHAHTHTRTIRTRAFHEKGSALTAPPPISSARPWRLASGVSARDTRSGGGSPTPSSPGAGKGLPGMGEGRLTDRRAGAASSRLPPPPPWQVEKQHRLLQGHTASSGRTGQPRFPASLAWSWTWESSWGKECE